MREECSDKANLGLEKLVFQVLLGKVGAVLAAARFGLGLLSQDLVGGKGGHGGCLGVLGGWLVGNTAWLLNVA